MDATRTILLDANTFIYAFDIPNNDATQTTEPSIIEARKNVKNWLSDSDVRLAITPLVRFEVLSKPKITSAEFEKLESALDELEEFEINGEIAKLAAQLMPLVLDEKERRTLAAHQEFDARKTKLKLRFDVLYAASAIQNIFEYASSDSDIQMIEDIYKKLLKN